MQVYHPDKPGGSTELAAKINTAADALSTGGFWSCLRKFEICSIRG
jgi:hypothetical protein